MGTLLNNADYGAYGPLKAFSTDRIRRQFDTNVIGLLEVTKAVLPHMRANRAGIRALSAFGCFLSLAAAGIAAPLASNQIDPASIFSSTSASIDSASS